MQLQPDIFTKVINSVIKFLYSQICKRHWWRFCYGRGNIFPRPARRFCLRSNLRCHWPASPDRKRNPGTHNMPKRQCYYIQSNRILTTTSELKPPRRRQITLPSGTKTAFSMFGSLTNKDHPTIKTSFLGGLFSEIPLYVEKK